jgi:hyperosmotically inducible periplasmic protein
MQSSKVSVLAIAIAVTLGIMPSARAFSQDSSAGQEMHESGDAMRNASSETGSALKHAYRGTADQMVDAKLTTKVKSALLQDATTRKFSIHVESDQGKVTIAGAVDSPSSANYVKSVVAAVDGVHSADSRLTWPTSER